MKDAFLLFPKQYSKRRGSKQNSRGQKILLSLGTEEVNIYEWGMVQLVKVVCCQLDRAQVTCPQVSTIVI